MRRMASYCGNALDPVAFRDEILLDGFLDCKFVLILVLHRLCLPKSTEVFYCRTVTYSVCILMISFLN